MHSPVEAATSKVRKMIKFSVAMPAYNASAYIGEALESVLSQTLAPVEVFVADDGSTDDTAKIAASFGNRVTCIRLSNSGPGGARKAAVERCTNEWIALCDSDDVWHPDHLARKASLITRFPEANLLFANFYSFGHAAISNLPHISAEPDGWPTLYIESQDGDFIKLRDPYRAFLGDNHCAYPSGLSYRASMYRKIGGIDGAFSRAAAEDAEFLRRFALDPNAIIAGDIKPTWGYRRHGSNYTAKGWKSDIGRADIFDAHLRKGIIPAHLVPEVRTAMLSARVAGFNNAYWSNAWADANAISTLISKRMLTPRLIIRMFKAKIFSFMFD